jgi:predicted neutral ceramidase superfamily lipid hydrolase
MVKRNNNIDKTLKNLSLNKEAPKSAFILLVLLYTITSVLTTRTSVMQGSMAIGDQMIKYNSFTGVFSMLGYICIICLVMLFRRVGYIVSMAAIILQFPLMIFNIFVRGNLNSLPGLFSSVLMIGAISIKIEKNYSKSFFRFRWFF